MRGARRFRAGIDPRSDRSEFDFRERLAHRGHLEARLCAREALNERARGGISRRHHSENSRPGIKTKTRHLPGRSVTSGALRREDRLDVARKVGLRSESTECPQENDTAHTTPVYRFQNVPG